MEEFEKNHNNVEFISGDVRLHDVLENVTKRLIELNKISLDNSHDNLNNDLDLSKNSLCDVLSIDLGGGYHPDTVFKVFYIWSLPRTIDINQLSQHSFHFLGYFLSNLKSCK